MSCEENKRRISAWLDGELSPHEIDELEKHIESCKTCSQTYHDFRDVSQIYFHPQQQYSDLSSQIMSKLPKRSFALGKIAAIFIFFCGGIIGGIVGFHLNSSSKILPKKERFPYVIKINDQYIRVQNEKQEQRLKEVMREIFIQEQKQLLNRYSVDGIPAQLIDYEDF